MLCVLRLGEYERFQTSYPDRVIAYLWILYCIVLYVEFSYIKRGEGLVILVMGD